MGRAFLSTAYLPSAPPPAPPKLQRWSPQNRFDPDDERLGGLDMVYEAIVDAAEPASPAPAATAARIDAVAGAAEAERDDASTDGESDTATALSSPTSAGSNEAAQLASLQRRLTAAAAGAPSAPTSPTTAPGAQTDTARRIHEHVAAISSLFDRVAPPSAVPGRSPRRAATLSSLDILTRPAVAQSI
ncbi:hypothetical protein AURDEDRAFT_113203 [Auricularia subglabra TFB-10046 SS5]|nr:hypothetical protein AURDEDRAFT_113203 [Auricularia subglabra TFB-10046 SS5]